jgi:hypothetical protein
MKQIKLITMIVALVCLAASCKKEPVTYRFAEEDKLKLLPHYIEGKIFTFANENGEERKMKVINVEHGIIQHRTPGGLGGGPDYYYYFEYKYFYMQDPNSNGEFYFLIHRLPINLRLAEENIYKEFPSHSQVTFNVTAFLLHYYMQGTFTFNQSITNMTIDNITYEKVHQCEDFFKPSNPSNLSLEDYWGIKTIYYDEFNGIIGFDDINNHEWRLKNSK